MAVTSLLVNPSMKVRGTRYQNELEKIQLRKYTQLFDCPVLFSGSKNFDAFKLPRTLNTAVLKSLAIHFVNQFVAGAVMLKKKS